MSNSKLLIDKFFSDPEWKHIEDLILGYIEPLIDMNTVDYKQPAEHVKAELIGRVLAYQGLSKFLADSKIISQPIKKINNPFI